MPGKSFLDAFGGGFLIGGTIFGFLIAAFWLDERACDQGDDIEVLSSRLEEKHELKK